MDKITYDLPWICSIISLILIVLLTSINTYFYIRKKFPVKVNCWFCNQWTKVLYQERNSFECPSCLQYNGFDSNGDYNKVLPAQYDIGLNKPVKASKTNSNDKTSSALCRLCNNNQQLRVFQLANFIPLNEDNFDVEIEHFQKQLDKAYKLCNHCENTLKTTIKRQNSLLGIKLSKLSQKGLALIDLNQSSDGISIEAKRSFLKIVVFYTIICFAFLNILHILSQYEFFQKNLNKFIQEPLLPYFIKIEDLYFTAANRIVTMCKHILSKTGFENNFTLAEHPFITDIFLVFELIGNKMLHCMNLFTLPPSFYVKSSLSLLCIVGVLLQFIWLLLDRFKCFKRCMCLLFVWLMLSSLELGYWVINPYADKIKIAASCLIISLMCINSTTSVKRLKMKKSKMNSRMSKNKIDDYLENSCDEEINSVSKIKNKIQPVFGQPEINLGQSNIEKSVCDISPAAKSTQNKTFAGANKIAVSNRDLEISLNKLHIGTPLMNTSTTFKVPHSYISPNVDRPRPVLSPAKLQNISPHSWQPGDFSKDSSCVLLPSNNLFGINQPRNDSSNFVQNNRFNLNSSYNSTCDGLEYNSCYSNPMLNLNTQTHLVGNHFNTCCPTFSCGNQLNAMYRPLINNEQLVYITPNCLQSTRYEIFGQNCSSDLFDTSYTDKVIKKDKHFGRNSDVFYN